ncbi:MAG: GrpB family protein [Candidatus Sericytochromatia bacterium]|nr:GrpB family protein [Candidatus Sericytochromatia bacterium]
MRFVEEHTVRSAVADAFADHAAALQALLPEADVQHVGSTAVPGSFTKGDLDIAVRVTAEGFATADRVLAEAFERNTGSDQSPTFASFLNDDLPIPLGIQLCVVGGPEDFFLQQRAFFRAHPEENENYNTLKLQNFGKTMTEYREAKQSYFEVLMASPAYTAFRP